MPQKNSQSNVAGYLKKLCLFLYLSFTVTLSSCGEKKEIIIEVEEEEVSQAPASIAAPSPKSDSGVAGGSESEPEPGSQDPSPNSEADADIKSTRPKTPSSIQPAVKWDPKEVANILNLYCAGPCHGVHGKFSNKEYFLSLKTKHLEQLTSEKMPPPGLFKNFRGSADQATLIDWLESQ